MSYILALLQFFTIAYICVTEFNRKSSVVFLWATLLIMFGVMHTFSVFGGDDTYTNDVFNEAGFFVVLFCSIYFVTRILLLTIHNSSKYSSVFKIVSANERKQLFLIFLLAICVFIKLYNFASFSGGILNTSWSSGRDYSASLGYVNSYQFLNITYFILSGLPLYYVLIKAKKEALLCFAIMLLDVLITRNRIEVLPILVCIIAYYVLKIKRLNFIHLLMGAFCAVVVIYVVYGLRVFRHYGSIDVFLSTFSVVEFVAKINTYIVTGNGELGLVNWFYYFIQHDNNFPAFETGASYIRMLLVYIPTQFSFGLKPDDFAIAMGQAIGMAPGGSTHPTLFGDCYANMGIFGILLGGFWAVYACVADRIVMFFSSDLYKILVYCLFSVTYVIIGRGSVYNSFFFVAYGLPALALVWYFHKQLPSIKLKFRGRDARKI